LLVSASATPFRKSDPPKNLPLGHFESPSDFPISRNLRAKKTLKKPPLESAKINCPNAGLGLPLFLALSVLNFLSEFCFSEGCSMATYRRINVMDNNGVHVVHFVDKKIVDSGTIESLGDELTGLVLNEKKNMLLLNFDSVEFMSSAALNKLISLNKKVKDAAGQLKLCCLRPEIGEVFKITRLDRVFDIRKDEATGLAAFKL
jgi:anti-sigma B factor antagonist